MKCTVSSTYGYVSNVESFASDIIRPRVKFLFKSVNISLYRLCLGFVSAIRRVSKGIELAVCTESVFLDEGQRAGVGVNFFAEF